MLCLNRYSFDLCGFEAAEAAALDVSGRGSKARCERQVTAVDNFLSQQDKKQKHHRRKRKCLQSQLEEVRHIILHSLCNFWPSNVMCKCIGQYAFS